MRMRYMLAYSQPRLVNATECRNSVLACLVKESETACVRHMCVILYLYVCGRHRLSQRSMCAYVFLSPTMRLRIEKISQPLPAKCRRPEVAEVF